MLAVINITCLELELMAIKVQESKIKKLGEWWKLK